jgi:tetratricopeptide (TPR) repeat protein
LVYVKKREFTLAVADFDQAIRLDPRYKTAYVYRGVANYNRTAYDSAIADFDAALRLDPDAIEALYGRGMAKQKNGDSSGAADIAAAKAIQSDIADVMTNYGVR